MLKTLLSIVDRILGLVERATETDASAPRYHEWIDVALKRRGKLVRDKRCQHCGVFRREPAQDKQICKTRYR